jgi:superfamily I DNA and/or RNA helicase
VAGTCVGLGRSSLGLTTTPFDLVVVDEAARCTASELAVPIQSGRWIVLVGDQAQLEPLHRSEVIEGVAASTQIPKREIKRSDFERTFESSYGRQAGRRLTQQYRMLPPIGRIVSAPFYSQALTHQREKPEIEPAVLPEELEKTVIWISTDGSSTKAYQRSDPAGGPSLINSAEAEIIIELLKRWDSYEPFRRYLEAQEGRRHTIGVICMYAAQRDLLRHKMRIAGFSEGMKSAVMVGTVDSYQGKENPIVVLSLVRNNSDGPSEAGRRTIRQGFLIRPNRVNVAMSRAMDRLILVGARSGWPSGGPMHRVAQAFSAELESGYAALVEAAALQSDLADRKKAEKKAGSAPTRRKDR